MRDDTIRWSAESKLATAGTTSICPDCGGEMARAGRVPLSAVCAICGTVQHIDVLNVAARKRQLTHLHARGSDRLLAAFEQRA